MGTLANGKAAAIFSILFTACGTPSPAPSAKAAVEPAPPIHGYSITLDRIEPRGPLVDLYGTQNFPVEAAITVERYISAAPMASWDEVAQALNANGRWEVKSMALRPDNMAASDVQLRAHARYRTQNEYSVPKTVVVPAVVVTIAKINGTRPVNGGVCVVDRDSVVTVAMRATDVLPGDSLWIGALAAGLEMQLLPNPKESSIQASQTRMHESTAEWERSIAIGEARRLMIRAGGISVPPGGSIEQFQDYSGPGAVVECRVERKN
jgi:hypothetical protein